MPRETLELQNKIVLLTGASEGIGYALARLLQFRGARLALVARSEQKLNELARQGDLVVSADLRLPADRARVVAETVSRFGRIDVLINNAAVGVYGKTIDVPLEPVRAMFEVNFFAPLELCQLSVSHMPRGSVIVNVSSIGGKITLPWATLYSATKHALDALTEGLRVELHAQGIDVLGVYPGHVRTGFQQHILHGRAANGLSPHRRLFTISAEECARLILRAIERRGRTLVAPRLYWFAVWCARVFPGALETRLRRMMQRLENSES
jgi:short-subunit dehydrogenase